jgi:hypothetical protein
MKEGLPANGQPLNMLAGPMGLEPTPSGVTGRRYNQLNYDPVKNTISSFNETAVSRSSLVGGTGLEPVTSTV